MRLSNALVSGEGDEAEPLPDRLEPLLVEIRRDRDPLGHAADLAKSTREAEAKERATLKRVPGWTGTAPDLAALSPATSAAFGRSAKALADAQAGLIKVAEERDRLAAQRAQWQAALAGIRERPLPDEAALLDARAIRDRGWQLIYARAFTATPDEAGEHAYAGREPLALAFERHIRAADAVADARIGEMARLEQAARLTADLAQGAPAYAAADARHAVALADRDRSAAEWAAACATLRLPSDATLAEVTALLTAREQAIEACRVADLARGAETALAASHADWADRLAGLLGGAAGPLASLLAEADAACGLQRRHGWMPSSAPPPGNRPARRVTPPERLRRLRRLHSQHGRRSGTGCCRR